MLLFLCCMVLVSIESTSGLVVESSIMFELVSVGCVGDVIIIGCCSSVCSCVIILWMMNGLVM